jgi:hypothetical protein
MATRSEKNGSDGRTYGRESEREKVKKTATRRSDERRSPRKEREGGKHPYEPVRGGVTVSVEVAVLPPEIAEKMFVDEVIFREAGGRLLGEKVPRCGDGEREEHPGNPRERSEGPPAPDSHGPDEDRSEDKNDRSRPLGEEAGAE